jgi:hypothetical protein
MTKGCLLVHGSSLRQINGARSGVPRRDQVEG